ACMLQALDDAGLSPADVNHVNAHGTSTPLNDEAEAAAITKVFGEHAVPVTGTKGVTGHLVGAAGAAEAVASVLALHHELVPPPAGRARRAPSCASSTVAWSAGSGWRAASAGAPSARPRARRSNGWFARRATPGCRSSASLPRRAPT